MRNIMYCLNCGILFEKPRSLSKKMWVKRKFCSRACSLKAVGIQKGKPLASKIYAGMLLKIASGTKRKVPLETRPRGSNHYRWKGGNTTKYCEHCGVSFSVRRYRGKSAKFCSRDCKIAAQDKGLSSENEKIRHSKKYREWREAVFERDDYTCQLCGVRGGVLNADHILKFSLFPELRFDAINGRTLCRQCHLNTPTFGRSIPEDVVAYTKNF